MRKLLLICSVISLIYGNCVWSMDYNKEEPYENLGNDSNLDPQKEKVYKNDEKQAIVSAASGKRNNFTENNSDLFNSTMRPVNANDLSKEESYKWILKIASMKKEGKDFNAPQNTEGQTILMCAAKDANCQIMKQILNVIDPEKRPAIINAQDKNGNTALSIAAEKDNIEMIVLLLTNGADVKSVNETKWTELLMHAEKNTYYEIMGKTILMHAAKDADCEIMKQILNAIDSEKRPAIINAQDKNGNTALSIAAKTGDDKKILLLLTNGADVKLAKEKLTEEQALNKLKELYKKVHNNNETFLNKLKELYNNNETFLNAIPHRNLKNAIPHSDLEYVKSLLETGEVNVNVRESDGYTALMLAAHEGHTDIVKSLLELKHDEIDVNAKDNQGISALMLAAHKGHTDIAELLLQHEKIDVNLWENKYRSTALMFAAQKGRTKIVELLLGHEKINVNLLDIHGVTALMIAAHKGHTDIVKLLLGHEKINVNVRESNGYTALMLAADKGHTDIVKSLLQHKNIDVNAKDKQGFTALMIAAQNGHTKIVELLLKHEGIDVNAKNEQGFTALMIAADKGHTDIADLLLQHEKIDVNAKNEQGFTALMIAAHKGHTKIVEPLLGHENIDVNAKNEQGFTALMIAAHNGHTDTVKSLLELKHDEIDVNAKDKQVFTALMIAAQNGHTKIVELLLKHEGIDVNAKDNQGYTALMFAAQDGHTKIVKPLLQHKNIDVNAKDKQGFTALMIAAHKGHTDIANLLLQHEKIDVNAKNEQGFTALMIAAQYGHTDIVKSLLQHKNIDVNALHNQGISALMIAAYNGHTDIVKSLLELKHDEIDVNAKSKQGYTALMLAAYKGHEKIVELLLERSNTDENMLDTILARAAINRHTKIVRLLLNQSSIDNRKGIDYSLSLSVVRGYEEVVKLFLEKGIDVNKYINGYTLLMHAIESGNAKMVHFLLKQPNINLEAKNADGETALDCAERKGRRSIIKLIKSKLGIQDQQVNPFIKRNKTDSMDKIRKRFWTVISRGDINEMDSLLDEEGKVLVDINAENKDGDTALIIASNNGNLTAVKWLLENKADLSIKDKNKDNALIRAARKGHLDVVDELLFWKANINSVGQHGRTALMEAAENGQVRVVKLLIKKGAKSSVKDDYGKTALDLVNEKKINKTDSDYESIKNILESLSKQSNQLFDEVKIETINKWEIVIDKDFEKDLEYWKKNSPAIYEKIKQLIEDIKIDPFRGPGKPERLTGDLKGLYSRRITDGDRLVYDIDGEKVILKSGKGHYKKDKRK